MPLLCNSKALQVDETGTVRDPNTLNSTETILIDNLVRGHEGKILLAGSDLFFILPRRGYRRSWLGLNYNNNDDDNDGDDDDDKTTAATPQLEDMRKKKGSIEKQAIHAYTNNL